MAFFWIVTIQSCRYSLTFALITAITVSILHIIEHIGSADDLTKI